jgi:hypothetical protein
MPTTSWQGRPKPVSTHAISVIIAVIECDVELAKRFTSSGDSAARKLYVHLVNDEDPFSKSIILGISYGFSFDEFAPVGSSQFFEGRLLGSPVVSQARDPLFWGKMSYSIGGISVINTDGEYDTFAQDNDVYGNEARIKFGYKQLALADFQIDIVERREGAEFLDDVFDFNGHAEFVLRPDAARERSSRPA